MTEVHTIRSGDLLAFHGRGFWSTLIRFRTLSRVTHVGFAVWIRSRLAVLEAKEGRGVRVYPIDRYLDDPDLRIDHYALNNRWNIDRKALLDAAWKEWGRRYASPWQFLRSWGLVSRRMADRFGWPVDTNPSRFFCSEYVKQCVLRAIREGPVILNQDNELTLDSHPAETSPGDVIELPCFCRTGEVARR